MTAFASVIERYEDRDSPLHRADARAKVLAGFAFIFVVSATPEGAWAAIALLGAPVVLGVFLSRLGVALVLRRTLLALPFIMAAVVGLQAVLFQDGGIAVLGANIFNMGILTALVGWAVYRGVRSVAGTNHTAALIAAFVGAWLSVEAAAILTAFQLAWSGTSPLDVALPAMAGVHALIGIGEGLITAAAFGFVVSTRPDLVDEPMAVSVAVR